MFRHYGTIQKVSDFRVFKNILERFLVFLRIFWKDFLLLFYLFVVGGSLY